MYKTGRKINKINFNKFIWFYWKMKKKILVVFPVAEMKKKVMEKKKGRVAGSRLGYCPFSVLSHDTIDCIVTQQACAHRG